MKDVIVIYDDLTKPLSQIRTITGEKTYGETILKRVTLKNRIRDEVLKNKVVKGFYGIGNEEDIEKLKKDLTLLDPDSVSVFYMYSSFGIREAKIFQNLLQKAAYINDSFQVVCGGKTAAVLLPSCKLCAMKLAELISHVSFGEALEENPFTDLSEMSQFLAYITSGFDARFFNSLMGDAYTVTKKSSKIEKIKSEYNFYYLLPDDMKIWFVMPYDYKESADGASYTMERYHMTDIAIRFVHGAIDTQELSEILDKLFYFLSHRTKKEVSEAVARNVADKLYLNKLQERMKQLSKTEYYEKLDALLKMGTKYQGIEDVLHLYKKMYDAIMKKHPQKNPCLVIGHGDLCFSNILYSRESSLLKLIDPKGAITKDELYTDMYYDLAKLSHSICGCYDFFNSGLYQVSMDRDMKWQLSVDCDAYPYKKVFCEKLAQYGYSYEKVRLFEASLFLSMLPYHVDQPGKVFAFLLNAIKILEEVQACTVI